jgi:hypothetical protein
MLPKYSKDNTHQIWAWAWSYSLISLYYLVPGSHGFNLFSRRMLVFCKKVTNRGKIHRDGIKKLCVALTKNCKIIEIRNSDWNRAHRFHPVQGLHPHQCPHRLSPQECQMPSHMSHCPLMYPGQLLDQLIIIELKFLSTSNGTPRSSPCSQAYLDRTQLLDQLLLQ